ncbi:hypothetical protein [Bradyrhizobium sp. CCBAU 53380]|uniref:hypothetical protein n=1 Tax=Bradyrhizobium sp. CCBAU 53380 TaxID=1325117 RepID=UPI0023043809|nr:hypothetical protein [Bradyrhizobium sp. CCBAU 53380]MDA9421072.1 hypothetical protein [Bradyrhizobium sp. CCBAU 53380]
MPEIVVKQAAEHEIGRPGLIYRAGDAAQSFGKRTGLLFKDAIAPERQSKQDGVLNVPSQATNQKKMDSNLASGPEV